jgi:hypothetical protein
MKPSNYAGQTFGRLLVVRRAERANGQHHGSWWFCQCSCGQTKTIRGEALRSGATKSCGCLYKDRIGKKSPRWTGGRSVVRGYVLINKHIPGKKSWRVREHVDIMSHHLGRPLRKGETVHHKNGIRDDNRIENLELWIRPQPTGVRLADAIQWSVELIRQYQPELLRT